MVHIRGAANIVRQHQANLLKTATGKQLLHLFGRLELSASRHLLIQDATSVTATTADTAFFDTPDVPLSLEDWTNGTGDFELAWTRMMKIMVPVTVLRMIPRQGDKGTQERKVEGERIQVLLREWSQSLPSSFSEIDGPEMMMILDSSPVQLQPLYYSSYNIAIAQAHHSALQINVFTLTHRGDEPKPPWLFDAVDRTLRIVLGVQRMRDLGVWDIPEGCDYGILWPLAIAAIRVPRGDLRTWIVDLLTCWPREGMIVNPKSVVWWG